MNILFLFPHIIVNIANAVLAGKVIHQDLPLFLSGSIALSFSLGSYLFNKKEMNISKLQLNVLWLLFSFNNYFFIFSNNVYVVLISSLINGMIISLQNKYYFQKENVFTNNWYLLLLSFGIGRLLGGFSGFKYFYYVYYMQIFITFIFLIILNLNLKYNFNFKHLNILKLKTKTNWLNSWFLIILQTTILTLWNYLFAFIFKQQAHFTSLYITLANIIIIICSSNKKIATVIFKYQLLWLLLCSLIWIIFTWNSFLIYLGLIILIITFVIISTLINTANNYSLKFNFIILCSSQLCSGLLFQLNNKLVIYTITILLFSYIINSIIKKLIITKN